MSPWQIIGIASLTLVLLFGLAVLLRNPTKSADTISLHIASKRHYFIIAALLLTFAGGAFYGFLLFWLLPSYQLPNFVYWVIISSFFAQLIVAWIPANSLRERSKVKTLHTFGGILVGTAMIICIWAVVLFGNNIPSISYAVAIITAIVGTVCYITLILGLWRYKQLLLISEITMIGLFSITLLLLALQL